MNYKFSCVLDYSPLMAVQSYIWVNNLLSISTIDPNDVYIHIVGEIPEELLSYFNDKKINVIIKSAFDERNKYCNKLIQLDTFKDIDFDYVFLMDCDTAVVSLEGLNPNKEVYTKIVDFPNPPVGILKAIFSKANVNFTACETTFEMNGSNITDWNNCNGGVYIISNTFLKALSPKWIEYALWCIDNANLFTETYSKHADQVGFALAMSSLNTKTTHLGIEWNYPTHVNKDILTDIKPKIIHYHNCLDEHMKVKRIGLENVDIEIDRLNELITDKLSKSLDNSLFWNLRYALYPKLGSGIGSRGEILNYKKNVIKYLIYNFLEKKIIDVGCGDLELTKDFKFKNYIGLDVSQEALKICKSKKPNWEFINQGITSNEITEADLIMCFDVLIHQSKEDDFKDIVKNIVNKGNERIVIGAYNEAPQYSSQITYFYNGILDEIKRYNKFNEIGVIAKYRDVSVVVATKHESNHKRDILSKDLNIAFTQVKRSDLLLYLVDVSRKELGFFTSHYPRVFEYTWLLEQLENINESSVLDIGAGISPLPICLNENGLKVTTVDSHNKIRLIKDKENWNEWGFLDYSIFNSSIKSLNIDFSKYNNFKLFDYIYSISVIEHMPSNIRIKILQKAAKLLKHDGIFLLTIDLMPNTNDLWNFSEDKEVEPIEKHGNIESFKQELNTCGFDVVEEEIQQNIKDSRTDVYYVKAILKRKNIFSRLFNLN